MKTSGAFSKPNTMSSRTFTFVSLLKCAENTGTRHSDLRKVRQSLFNLLSNACKFTDNGTMTLSVGREQPEGGDWTVFRVHETGIGMTPEQMGVCFKSSPRRMPRPRAITAARDLAWR